jgi:hypothetical protein
MRVIIRRHRSLFELSADQVPCLGFAPQETQPGKKVIIVFTDGDDNASVLTAQNAVTRAQKNGDPLFTIAEGERPVRLNLRNY